MLTVKNTTHSTDITDNTSPLGNTRCGSVKTGISSWGNVFLRLKLFWNKQIIWPYSFTQEQH